MALCHVLLCETSIRLHFKFAVYIEMQLWEWEIGSLPSFFDPHKKVFHPGFALISTFTGLSQASSRFPETRWYLKKTWERQREAERCIPSKCPRKQPFFWWIHWTKSHVSSVSHPKSACHDHLLLTLISKHRERTIPHKRQHPKCSKRQKSEFNSQQQAHQNKKA